MLESSGPVVGMLGSEDGENDLQVGDYLIYSEIKE